MVNPHECQGCSKVKVSGKYYAFPIFFVFLGGWRG